MNQRVAAQTVCFLAKSSTLRSRYGRPQRGVCPFLALWVLAMLSRGRGSYPAASSGRPRVGGVSSCPRTGISLWPWRNPHSRFWSALATLKPAPGTIFTAPIEFLVGTGSAARVMALFSLACGRRSSDTCRHPRRSGAGARGDATEVATAPQSREPRDGCWVGGVLGLTALQDSRAWSSFGIHRPFVGHASSSAVMTCMIRDSSGIAGEGRRT